MPKYLDIEEKFGKVRAKNRGNRGQLVLKDGGQLVQHTAP